jgi:type IX secretion system PorP/SprF family membrane protein
LFRAIRKILTYFLLTAEILITGNVNIYGQDPVLSQFYSNTVYLNPAFTGSSGRPRISAGYRNQFPSLGQVYVDYHTAFDMPSSLFGGGFGFNVMNDVQAGGQLNNLRFDGIYSHAIILHPEVEMIAGLQASYVIRSIRTDGLILPDGIDNLTGNYYPDLSGEELSDQTVGYPDFAAGVLFFTRAWYAGFALHHITAPNMSFSRSYREILPRKYTFHAGINIPVFEKRFGREYLQISPNLVYIQQGSQRQLNIGAEVMRKGAFAGVWCRQNIRFGLGAVTAVAGYQDERMRVGYSYDFNMLVPWVTFNSTGAHEISFTWRFSKSDKKTKMGTINCPKI